jgi:hypothetical protein
VFLAALLVLCWRPWRGSSPSLARLAVFGVLFAVSVEVRPIALLALPMVAVALWRRAEWRRWLVQVAVVTGTLLVVMLPWTVRNQVVMHAFLPIGTTTGDNLCIGNHPGAQGHFAFPDFCFGDDEDIPRPAFETGRNTKLTSRALDWIVHHPAEQLHLIPQRTFYTFEHDHDAVPAVQSYGDDPFIPPRTAIVLGDLAEGDRRRLLLVLSMVAVAIAPWPFFGDSRFHVPIDVLVPIPAALTVVVMARRWRHRDDVVGETP